MHIKIAAVWEILTKTCKNITGIKIIPLECLHADQDPLYVDISSCSFSDHCLVKASLHTVQVSQPIVVTVRKRNFKNLNADEFQFLLLHCNTSINPAESIDDFVYLIKLRHCAEVLDDLIPERSLKK